MNILPERLEDRIAPATLLAGARAVQYTDADGDIVTIRISKGRFDNPADPAQDDFVFGDTQTGLGEQLEILDLSNKAIFDGAALTITAIPGPTGGDGVVNVGYINAIGVDLSTVLVRGDLGAINVGDNVTDAALGSLTVLSLGTQGGTTGAPDLQSQFLGAVGSIRVMGDIFAASIDIRGETTAGKVLGNLGSLYVGGSLVGGGGDAQGIITVRGSIGKVTIGGDLFGGGGETSATIVAQTIGAIAIGGSVVGGAGNDSGQVFGRTAIGAVTIGGTLSGGDGEFSGVVGAPSITSVAIGNSVFGGVGVQSGSVQGGKLGAVSIGGSLFGGDGARSGRVAADTTITNVIVGASVVGGSGEFSGAIVADQIAAATVRNSVVGGAGGSSGSIQTTSHLSTFKIFGSLIGGGGNFSGLVFVQGTLVSASIGGNLLGGSDDGTNFLSSSGYVHAGRIGTMVVGGSVFAGDDNGGGNVNSGAIRSASDIGSLTVRGSLEGRSVPVIISAVGQANSTGAVDLAIGSLTVGGRVFGAEILAGYSPDLTNSPYGEPVNADAQIGTVRVGGNWIISNLIAGVARGSDTYFGDSNDAKISGTGIKDNLDSRTISRITAVIIGGYVAGSSAADDVYRGGIGAQWIGRVVTGGVAVLPLHGGISNDTFAATATYALGTTRGVGNVDSRDFHVYEI